MLASTTDTGTSTAGFDSMFTGAVSEVVDVTTGLYTSTSVVSGDPTFSIQEWIIVLFTPITIVFGTIGNLLTVTILLRERFRLHSINLYLIGLAVADTAFLWTNSMTRNFIKIFFGFNFSAVSMMNCIAYVYVLYVSKCLSAWFTVAVTIQRLIVVLFPYKARLFDKRKKAAWTVTFLTMSVFGIFIFIPIMGVYHVVWDNKNGENKCQMRTEYKVMHIDVILKTLDLLIYSLFPTVILTLSNSVLIYKLVLSARFQKENAVKRNQEQEAGARRLTITLTLVSSCFLICTVPMSSFLLHAQIYTTVAHFDIFYRSFYVLQLLNSAVNFLLYCASGPTFREELRKFAEQMCAGCIRCKGHVINAFHQEKSAISSESRPGTPTTSATTIEGTPCNVNNRHDMTDVDNRQSLVDVNNRQSVTQLVWTTSTGDINVITRL